MNVPFKNLAATMNAVGSVSVLLRLKRQERETSPHGPPGSARGENADIRDIARRDMQKLAALLRESRS